MAVKGLGLLTLKPLIYAANVMEDDLADQGANNTHVQVGQGNVSVISEARDLCFRSACLDDEDTVLKNVDVLPPHLVSPAHRPCASVLSKRVCRLSW